MNPACYNNIFLLFKSWLGRFALIVLCKLSELYFLQRWLPLEGFSGRLLPTDRFHYSSQDGTRDRSLDKIRLPSMAWQWEGDWHLETTLDGLSLDHDVSSR